MAISDNIQERAELIGNEINANPGQPSPSARALHALATKAILGGIQDWVNYVKEFAKSPEELARLIPTDGTTDDTHNSARAYLAANGMCTEQTTPNLMMRVTTDLDL